MSVVQLSRSLQLLERAEAGHAGARFITVERPTALLGRRQDALILDSGAVDRLGWDLLQRLTPGGVVYMDRSAVCLEVALPASHRRFTADVVAATRWFGTLFVRALSHLGLEAALAPTTSPPARGLAAQACFASWVRGEVLVEGRKVFGTAQYRRRGGALFQGVGLSAGSHDAVAAVLAGDDQARSEAAAAIERASAAIERVPRDLEDAIRHSLTREGLGFSD